VRAFRPSKEAESNSTIFAKKIDAKNHKNLTGNALKRRMCLQELTLTISKNK
jgi:hypothetical protein